ncbi:MAG: hypothetical protein UIG59_02415, partial [Acutalibacteraceae bacterium]|nr:hypothetical protein [Acutalibacteraceae bacterium]
MLEFLIGRACTGKTYDIVKRVTEDSKNGKVIFIVPEQFSFESERAVIKYENAVLDNIRVLSFSRLFDDVLDFSAVGSISCVSDFEKIILLKKALQACADDLVIFSKYTSYNDFIINLGDTIKDLKFAAVTPEQLITAAEDIGGTCSAKLRDIALVMSTYNALLHNKYIDPSDRLTKLAELLVDCDYFKDTTVYFDSFTGFTGQQYKIIEKIFEQTDKVTFSFCTDDINNTNISVFYNINNSVKRIQQIAKSRGISEYSVIKKSTAYYSNDAMQKVEHFLAKNQATPDALIGGSLKIISCKNKREEALAAANIVAKEVAENGYRFKDFIVVARNADDYANLFSAQCVNNNISCFMDKSVALTQTPLYLYLDKLFETLSSFSTDAILAFLKIGLTNYSLNEISELEDYTFIWDIKPADWATNWEMSVKGLRTDEDNEYDTAKLEQINRTRSSIVEVLSEFKNDFHGSPKSMAKAIYNHLVKYSVDKNLLTLCDYFENNGNQYYASILKQSWDLLISILNSMVRVLDDNTNSAEFIDLFRIAASNAKISNIPQMLDEVTFGAADRIRPSKPKIS